MSGAKISPRRPTRRHDGVFGCAAAVAFSGFGFSFSLSFPERSSAGSTSISFPSSSITTYSYSWRNVFSRRRRCFRLGMASSLAPPGDPSFLHDRGDDVAGEVVGKVPPVGGVEEHDVGRAPGREPATVRPPED